MKKGILIATTLLLTFVCALIYWHRSIKAVDVFATAFGRDASGDVTYCRTNGCWRIVEISKLWFKPLDGSRWVRKRHLVELKSVQLRDSMPKDGLRSLHDLPVLKRIILSGYLSDLSVLPTLQEICMSGDSCSSDISNLAKCAQLRKLTLESLYMSGRDLFACCKIIGNLQNLEVLDMPGYHMTDANVSELAKSISLRKLVLRGEAIISDASIDTLAICPNLRSLDLSGANVKMQGLSKLGKLSQLEELVIVHLRASTIETNLVDWTTMTNLSTLNMDVCCGKTPEIRTPKDLRSLRINIANYDGRRDVFPDWIRHIESVDVWCDLDDRSKNLLESICSLTNCVKLGSSWQTTNTGGWATKVLENLKVVSLELDCWTNLNTCLQALARNGFVKALKISGTMETCQMTEISSEWLQYLSQMRKLEYLEINLDRWCPNKINLVSLQNLKELRELRLDVPADDYSFLHKLTNLRKLECRSVSNGITVLGQLDGLDQLEDIVLLHTFVSDRCLESLRNLRGLQRLNLTDCYGYSDQSLSKLMDESSSLQVVTKSCRSRESEQMLIKGHWGHWGQGGHWGQVSLNNICR